jgi:hypothetical protein
MFQLKIPRLSSIAVLPLQEAHMASFICTRTIKGHEYVYLEERWREGGKMRSRSRIIRKKKKRGGGGFPPVNPLNLLIGAVALGVHVAKYGVKGRNYQSPPDTPGHRARIVADNQLRELGRLYGVDEPNRERFAATRHLITPEYRALRASVVRGYREQLRTEREARMTPSEKAAKASLAADRAEQAEKSPGGNKRV